MKAGDVFENPATGEYGYIRVGSHESNGELLVADLRVRPGGAVLGEHSHPIIKERFTVIEGAIGFKLGDQKGIARAGDTLDILPGVPHDWWNAGDDEARVIVQIRPGGRFEKMALTMFGLAQEKKTNAKGEPNLFQLAVIAKEYRDVLQLTNPPGWVQSIIFAVLAPLGKLMGYKSSYQRFENITKTVDVEPLPGNITIKDLDA